MYIHSELNRYDDRKEEIKYSGIFRPWDNQSEKKCFRNTAQDSTISTTTRDDDDDDDDGDKFEQQIPVVQENLNKGNTNIKNNTEIPRVAQGGKINPTLHGEVFLSNFNSGCGALKNSNCQTPLLNKMTNNHLEHSCHPHTPSICPKLCKSLMTNPEIFLPSTSIPIDCLQDPYNAMGTDLVQTNLAQHLGLPPNDPLLLESLAQGYALEEYARVLNQEQQAKLMAAKKQRPKKYKCPHCDVGFSNNGQLKGHIRIHTGERPFKCDEKDCGKTFTRNEELTRHKRIHSGLRPFPCSHCGKRFGRKDHLKKHSRTHFQPRGLYAVPVVLPFEAWASGQTNGYPFFPVMY